jgi:hypothetical protein
VSTFHHPFGATSELIDKHHMAISRWTSVRNVAFRSKTQPENGPVVTFLSASLRLFGVPNYSS